MASIRFVLILLVVAVAGTLRPFVTPVEAVPFNPQPDPPRGEK